MRLKSGYVTGCDGTRLYYQLAGQGPALIGNNGIGVSTFFWKHYQEHFSDRYTFITYDYRGHGRSEPPVDPKRITMETLAEDLALLVKHLELDRPMLLGHSMGVQVILEYFKRFPAETGALVLVLGSYGRPMDTFMNSSLSRPIFDQVTKTARRFPKLANRIHRLVGVPRYTAWSAGPTGMIDGMYFPRRLLTTYLEHIGNLDTQLFLGMMAHMADHSAEDVLERISVPTLIVAGELDIFTPTYLSYEMQKRIPGAELLLLRRGSHAALVEQPEVITEGLEDFLKRHPLPGARA